MIKDNPFLGPQWVPLAKAITYIVKLATAHSPFVLQTYGRRYGYMPYDSPYFQGYYDHIAKEFILEASGNLQVKPPLTEQQYSELEFYGWKLPSQTPQEFGEDGYQPDATEASPNFLRVFEGEPNYDEIVEVLMTAMVGIFKIDEDDFFNFGEGDIPNQIDRMRLLGRVVAGEFNQNREIFAMPGRNLQAIGE